MDATALNKKAPTAAIISLIVGYAMANQAMVVLMNQIVEEYRLTGAAQGSMNSMINLGSFVAVILVPLMQGRVKKTLLLSLSALLQAAALFITGLSPSFGLLLASCCFLGLAMGWIDNGCNSAMVDLHSANSGRYMGMLHGFFGIGSIVTPLLIQGLLLFTGWRSVYTVIAVLAVAIAAIFIAITQKRRAVFAATSDSEAKLDLRQLRALIKDRYSLCLVLVILFYTASQNVIMAWVVRYMSVEYNAEAMGSLSVSLLWAASTLSRFVAPRLRVQPIRAIAFGVLASALAYAIGVLSGSAVVMFIMSGVVGLLTGFALPMLLTEAVSRFPGATSLPTTVMILATKVAMIAVPLLVGALSAAFSLTVGMMSYLLFALLAGVAALVAKRVK